MNENDLLDELLNDFATIPAVGEKEEEQPKEAKEEAAQADFPALDEAEETVAQPSAESVEEEPAQSEQAEEPPVEQPASEPADELQIVVSHMDAPTQVVSLEQLAVEQEQATEEEDPFEGQMTLADFVEEEQETQQEEEVLLEDEISWEEQLEQTRREKIRDFQIQKNREDTDFRIGDDEAPDELPDERVLQNAPRYP